MDFINIVHAGVITDAPLLSLAGLKILSFLLSVFEVVAIMMLVVSGGMYFFSFGNEKKMEKAKQSAKYATIGVILILAAIILVKTVGQFFD